MANITQRSDFRQKASDLIVHIQSWGDAAFSDPNFVQASQEVFNPQNDAALRQYAESHDMPGPVDGTYIPRSPDEREGVEIALNQIQQGLTSRGLLNDSSYMEDGSVSKDDYDVPESGVLREPQDLEEEYIDPETIERTNNGEPTYSQAESGNGYLDVSSAGTVGDYDDPEAIQESPYDLPDETHKKEGDVYASLDGTQSRIYDSVNPDSAQQYTPPEAEKEKSTTTSEGYDGVNPDQQQYAPPETEEITGDLYGVARPNPSRDRANLDDVSSLLPPAMQNAKSNPEIRNSIRDEFRERFLDEDGSLKGDVTASQLQEYAKSKKDDASRDLLTQQFLSLIEHQEGLENSMQAVPELFNAFNDASLLPVNENNQPQLAAAERAGSFLSEVQGDEKYGPFQEKAAQEMEELTKAPPLPPRNPSMQEKESNGIDPVQDNQPSTPSKGGNIEDDARTIEGLKFGGKFLLTAVAIGVAAATGFLFIAAIIGVAYLAYSAYKDSKTDKAAITMETRVEMKKAMQEAGVDPAKIEKVMSNFDSMVETKHGIKAPTKDDQSRGGLVNDELSNLLSGMQGDGSLSIEDNDLLGPTASAERDISSAREGVEKAGDLLAQASAVGQGIANPNPQDLGEQAVDAQQGGNGVVPPEVAPEAPATPGEVVDPQSVPQVTQATGGGGVSQAPGLETIDEVEEPVTEVEALPSQDQDEAIADVEPLPEQEVAQQLEELDEGLGGSEPEQGTVLQQVATGLRENVSPDNPAQMQEQEESSWVLRVTGGDKKRSAVKRAGGQDNEVDEGVENPGGRG